MSRLQSRKVKFSFGTPKFYDKIFERLGVSLMYLKKLLLKAFRKKIVKSFNKLKSSKSQKLFESFCHLILMPKCSESLFANLFKKSLNLKLHDKFHTQNLKICKTLKKSLDIKLSKKFKKA